MPSRTKARTPLPPAPSANSATCGTPAAPPVVKAFRKSTPHELPSPLEKPEQPSPSFSAASTMAPASPVSPMAPSATVSMSLNQPSTSFSIMPTLNCSPRAARSPMSARRAYSTPSLYVTTARSTSSACCEALKNWHRSARSPSKSPALRPSTLADTFPLFVAQPPSPRPPKPPPSKPPPPRCTDASLPKYRCWCEKISLPTSPPEKSPSGAPSCSSQSS
jgi:hypothetical protein